MTWTTPFRRLRQVVLLGGQDITPWVSQAVVSRACGMFVPTCSITMAHKKLPYFLPGSFSAGEQPLEVWVKLSTKLTSDWRRIFVGTTETPDNAGFILPGGTLRVASTAKRWATHQGCLLVSAFAGQTRLDLVDTFAANQGIALTVTGTVTSATLKKPVDISCTLVDLLNTWPELDGWQAREKDGELEVLPFAALYGPDATSGFDFLPSIYDSLQEAPPFQPRTDYIIEGHEAVLMPDGEQAPVEVLDNGVGPDKNVITRTITDGVVSREVTERYETYQPKGVTNGASAYQVVKRVTVDFTHQLNGAGKPTGRILTKTEVTEEFYAPKADTGTGDPNYTFEAPDSGFHTQNIETLQETRRKTETYTWNADKCFLETGVIEIKGWLAPESEAAFSDPTYTWPDSVVRSAHEETYQVVSVESWRDILLNPGDSSSNASFFFAMLNAPALWRGQCWGSKRHSDRINAEKAIAWIENPDGLSHVKTTREYPGTSGDPLGLFAASGIETYTMAPNETVDGPIPRPPTESGLTRMYALKPFISTFTVTSSMPRVIPPGEYLAEAENDTEAMRAARWRARKAFAVAVNLSHPIVPGILEWDPVRISAARRIAGKTRETVRNYSLRMAWLHALEWTLAPSHGLAWQKSTIMIDQMAGIEP